MTDLDEKISEYRQQSAIVSKAHYAVGETRARMHAIIGGVIAIAAAILATSILTSLSEVEPAARWVEACISVLVGILASLQAFLELQPRSVRHKLAGASYGDVRRRLELLQLAIDVGTKGTEDGFRDLADIADTLHVLAAESPHLPMRAYKRAARLPTVSTAS